MDELQPSDELAYRAFMVLVKDIASEITSSSQLEMLGFFEGQQVSEAKGKSALELLSGMMKKGRFSYKNTEPLQRKLTEIDRPDLARLVDKYQQEYPVRELTPIHRVNSLPTDKLASPSTAAARNPRHSLPAIATPLQYQDPLKSLPRNATALPTRVQRASVLTEEGAESEMGLGSEAVTKSLLVGGKTNWIKDLSINSLNNPPTLTSDHTHQDTPTSPSAVTPVMTVPPGHTHHPRHHLDHNEDNVSQVSASVSSKSVEIVGTLDLEGGQLHLSLPYATTATLAHTPSPGTSLGAGPGASPSGGRRTGKTSAHAGEAGSREGTSEIRPPTQPHPPTKSLASQHNLPSSYSKPPEAARMGSMEVRPGVKQGQGWPEGGRVVNTGLGGSSEVSNILSASQSNQQCGQGTVAGQPGQAVTVEENLSSSLTSSLSQGRSVTYRVQDCVRLDASDLSLKIGDRKYVGVEIAEFSLSLPIKCSNQPTLNVKVVPRPQFHSKWLAVMATLHVPSKCSRHKWLGLYSSSLIRVSTAVYKEGQNASVSQDSACEPIVCTSELSCDSHMTHLSLQQVLEHEQVVYDKASHFTLQVTAELEVLGFRVDESASQYRAEELEGEGQYVTIDKIQETNQSVQQ